MILKKIRSISPENKGNLETKKRNPGDTNYDERERELMSPNISTPMNFIENREKVQADNRLLCD